MNYNHKSFDTKSKKRNSICLEAKQSFRLDNIGLGLSRPDSFYGNFRKSRRFSDSTDVMPIPGVLSSTHMPIKKEPFSGSERRSSMTVPKNPWPEVNNQVYWDTPSAFHPIPLQQNPTLSVENFLPFDIPSLDKRGSLEEKQPYQYYYLDDMKTIGLLKQETRTEVKKLNRKGAWTKEEDELLIKYAGKGNNKNKNWTEIAEQIPGRTAKQCRERWCFNLDPAINKDNWTVEEDLLLIKRQAALGNKWAQIAQLLPGRTENAVKTRFKSILRARRREWKPHEDLQLLELQQKLGANWEIIASSLESHRTKHAVKMRFKELQQGLHKVKDPEKGSARQTVRKMLYPKENLTEVSRYYQQLADGIIEVQKPLKKISSFKAQNSSTTNAEEFPIDDFFLSFEEEPLILV